MPQSALRPAAPGVCSELVLHSYCRYILAAVCVCVVSNGEALCLGGYSRFLCIQSAQLVASGFSIWLFLNQPKQRLKEMSVF